MAVVVVVLVAALLTTAAAAGVQRGGGGVAYVCSSRLSHLRPVACLGHGFPKLVNVEACLLLVGVDADRVRALVFFALGGLDTCDIYSDIHNDIYSAVWVGCSAR